MDQTEVKVLSESEVDSFDDWSEHSPEINISTWPSPAAGRVVASVIVVVGVAAFVLGEGALRPFGGFLVLFGLFPFAMYAWMDWRRNQPKVHCAVRPGGAVPGGRWAVRWSVPDAGQALCLKLLLAVDEGVEHDGGVTFGRRFTAELIQSRDRAQIAFGGLEFDCPPESQFPKSRFETSYGLRWVLYLNVDYDGLRAHRSHVSLYST